MRFLGKFFKAILCVLLVAVVLAGSYYRADIGALAEKALHVFGSQPCSSPITYSIGTFDESFGITRNQFLAAISQAEAIWESPIQKPLFSYSDAGDGDLKINLIYDYRQKATAEMQKIGIVIKDDTSTYNQLKAKYTSLSAAYAVDKAALESKISSFQARQASYRQLVDYWNKKGGAPKDEYATLEAERLSLNAEVVEINKEQQAFNSSVELLNSTAVVLNRLGSELNLNVSSYNSVGASTGPEFDEGEYVSDSSGTRINIYQFDNNDKLVRVLAHELGHALGLGHLDNPKAIMYRLNQGVNEKLTADDIAALKNLCRIK